MAPVSCHWSCVSRFGARNDSSDHARLVLVLVACGVAADLHSSCQSITLRVETKTHRWHEIPGAELSVAGRSPLPDPRRLAAAVLLPRVKGFICGVAGLTILFGEPVPSGSSHSLRLRLARTSSAGVSPDALVTTPLALFGDALDAAGIPAWDGHAGDNGLRLLVLADIPRDPAHQAARPARSRRRFIWRTSRDARGCPARRGTSRRRSV